MRGMALEYPHSVNKKVITNQDLRSTFFMLLLFQLNGDNSGFYLVPGGCPMMSVLGS